jgi:chemotaxis protein methyltransferase WspC
VCSEAHYLLGVIALAGNNEEQAMERFNKVVYLEPDHAEALVHLSLLMEKRGLEGQASRYRKRLERLGEGSSP